MTLKSTFEPFCTVCFTNKRILARIAGDINREQVCRGDAGRCGCEQTAPKTVELYAKFVDISLVLVLIYLKKKKM